MGYLFFIHACTHHGIQVGSKIFFLLAFSSKITQAFLAVAVFLCWFLCARESALCSFDSSFVFGDLLLFVCSSFLSITSPRGYMRPSHLFTTFSDFHVIVSLLYCLQKMMKDSFDLLWSP